MNSNLKFNMDVLSHLINIRTLEKDVLLEKAKKLYLEAKSFNPFLCLGALIFAYLGSGEDGFQTHHQFYEICFYTMVKSFWKASLAEVMSIVTWKTISYNWDMKQGGLWYILTLLAAIHLLWIYITNMCLSCVLTKLETSKALCEFLSLILLLCILGKSTLWVVWNLYCYYKWKFQLTSTTPEKASDTDVLPNQSQSENANSRDTLTDNRNWNEKRLGKNRNTPINLPVQGVSSKTGIPYCKHKKMEKNFPQPIDFDSQSSIEIDVEDLEDNDNIASPLLQESHEANNRSSCASSGDSSVVDNAEEWQLLKSTTRSGKVYNTMHLNLNSMPSSRKSPSPPFNR